MLENSSNEINQTNATNRINAEAIQKDIAVHSAEYFELVHRLKHPSPEFIHQALDCLLPFAAYSFQCSKFLIHQCGLFSQCFAALDVPNQDPVVRARILLLLSTVCGAFSRTKYTENIQILCAFPNLQILKYIKRYIETNQAKMMFPIHYETVRLLWLIISQSAVQIELRKDPLVIQWLNTILPQRLILLLQASSNGYSSADSKRLQSIMCSCLRILLRHFNQTALTSMHQSCKNCTNPSVDFSSWLCLQVDSESNSEDQDLICSYLILLHQVIEIQQSSDHIMNLIETQMLLRVLTKKWMTSLEQGNFQLLRFVCKLMILILRMCHTKTTTTNRYNVQEELLLNHNILKLISEFQGKITVDHDGSNLLEQYPEFTTLIPLLLLWLFYNPSNQIGAISVLFENNQYKDSILPIFRFWCRFLKALNNGDMNHMNHKNDVHKSDAWSIALSFSALSYHWRPIQQTLIEEGFIAFIISWFQQQANQVNRKHPDFMRKRTLGFLFSLIPFLCRRSPEEITPLFTNHDELAILNVCMACINQVPELQLIAGTALFTLISNDRKAQTQLQDMESTNVLMKLFANSSEASIGLLLNEMMTTTKDHFDDFDFVLCETNNLKKKPIRSVLLILSAGLLYTIYQSNYSSFTGLVQLILNQQDLEKSVSRLLHSNIYQRLQTTFANQ